MNAQADLLEGLGDNGGGIAARECALSVIEQVLGQKKMLDSVLERDAGLAALDTRDRAFVRMLVATALRRRGQLDDLIAHALAKGEAPRPETLKWILYIGITQILFMEVADHAAVDTSVTLATRHNMEGKKGFVNAILRRMTGEGREWVAQQDAAVLNIPEWLYAQWIHDYGAVRAKEVALSSLEEAAIDITVKDKDTREDWRVKLDAKLLPTGSIRRMTGGNVTEFPGFNEGAWWVQDASSALPVRFFGDVAGKTVLDLCAAPGGKTAQLAASGAKVIAVDRSAARMKTLSENLKRVGLDANVQTIIEDGSLWKPRDTYKYILLDAPCTATGTIRRHPDLLALKNEKDQAGLMSIQERLLANAAQMLEKGGIMIYCTCSLQKAEGEHQVDAFLEAHPNFRRVPMRREEFGNIDHMVNSDGDIRVLPQTLKDQGGMDGFFVSRLQRVS